MLLDVGMCAQNIVLQQTTKSDRVSNLPPLGAPWVPFLFSARQIDLMIVDNESVSRVGSQDSYNLPSPLEEDLMSLESLEEDPLLLSLDEDPFLLDPLSLPLEEDPLLLSLESLEEGPPPVVRCCGDRCVSPGF